MSYNMTVDVDIAIEAVCENCGDVLDIESHDEKRGTHRIAVLPCGRGVERARAEGDAEGYRKAKGERSGDDG